MPAGQSPRAPTPENTFQAVSGTRPGLSGDGNGRAATTGGGAGLGIADSLYNLWQDPAPEELNNPEENQWR